MRNEIRLLILSVCMCSLDALGANVERAYIDKDKNVHILENGEDRCVTTDRRSFEIEVSPDRQVVLWLGADSGAAEIAPGAASELFVYREGKVRKLTCDTYVRGFWFWMRGKQIGLACGGLHFAGQETLYDADTLEVVDSFDQYELPPNRRPVWSETSDAFSGDED